MLTYNRIQKDCAKEIQTVFNILRECGSHMYEKQGLTHWKDPYPIESIKSDCENKEVYLAYYNSEPVGTFQLIQKDEINELSKFAVLPHKAGKGIGSLMLENIFLKSQDKHAKKIVISVYDQSKQAILFYEKNGFVKTGTTQTKHFTVHIMEKYLNKKILFIGAGFLQSYVIKKAKELGYITCAVDADSKAVGFKYADHSAAINIVDEKACLDYARSLGIDGVMTAATDYGVYTAAYISDVMGLPGITPKAARTVKNKYLSRKALSGAQADDSEPGYEISCIAQAIDLRDILAYPVMVKPCDGSGSRGASKVSNAGDLEQACVYAMEGSASSRAVIEPFITDGIEYGAETFVYQGEPHVLAVMKKWMTRPPYYAELGHAIPSGLSAEVEGRVINAVQKAVKALGITAGAVNMDILITPQKTIHIVDIGARMGGNLIGSHIIPLGTGYNYMENLIRAAAGDKPELPLNKTGAPVTTRLLALTPGIAEELPDFKNIEKTYGVKIEHHLNVGQEINPYRTNLDGCGYIISTSDSPQSATEKAELALKAIDNGIKRKGAYRDL